MASPLQFIKHVSIHHQPQLLGGPKTLVAGAPWGTCRPAYLRSPGKVSYAHPASSVHIHENRHIRALNVSTQETGLTKKLFPLMTVFHYSVLIQQTPESHWAKQISSAGA